MPLHTSTMMQRILELPYLFWRAAVPNLDKLFHFMKWILLTFILASLGSRVILFLAENGWSAVAHWAMVIWVQAHPVETVRIFLGCALILLLLLIICFRAHRSPLAHPERLVAVSIRRFNLADMRYKFGVNPSKRYYPRQPYFKQVCEILRQAAIGQREKYMGAIVFGIPMVGKTRLVVEALRLATDNFMLLLWRKRYGLLPLTAFERFYGKRLVLMFDDIQEYTSPDEAQGILDIIERLRVICKPLVIVATSRTGTDQDLAERTFGTLIDRLQRIALKPFEKGSEEAKQFLHGVREEGIEVDDDVFDGTPGSILLGLGPRTAQLRDPTFPDGPRAVLQALALLRYARIYVYPEYRVRRVAMAVFGLSDNIHIWRSSLRQLIRSGWVDVTNDTFGRSIVRLPTDAYLDRCVRDAEIYPIPGSHIEDDLRALKGALTDGSAIPDADALLSLSVALREYTEGDRLDQIKLAVDCATTALAGLSPASDAELWARGKNTLGIAYASLHDARYLQAALDAFTDALSVRTQEAYPMKWAELTYNRVLVRMRIIRETTDTRERRAFIAAAIAELRSALAVFTPDSDRHDNVQTKLRELAMLEEEDTLST